MLELPAVCNPSALALGVATSHADGDYSWQRSDAFVSREEPNRRALCYVSDLQGGFATRPGGRYFETAQSLPAGLVRLAQRGPLRSTRLDSGH